MAAETGRHVLGKLARRAAFSCFWSSRLWKSAMVNCLEKPGSRSKGRGSYQEFACEKSGDLDAIMFVC